MIRKIIGLIFAVILVIACVFRVVLAVLGVVLVLAAWLI